MIKLIQTRESKQNKKKKNNNPKNWFAWYPVILKDTIIREDKEFYQIAFLETVTKQKRIIPTLKSIDGNTYETTRTITEYFKLRTEKDHKDFENNIPRKD